MTRSELIARLASRQRSLTAPDVTLCVTHLLDAIAGALSTGNRVEVRGFGSWSIGQRAGRTGRNPLTGAPVQVPAKAVIRFKAGQELRQRVDGG